MPDLTVAAETATADAPSRTISGRIVPYGPAGQTSQGRLTFAAGSLRYGDPKRVKLLLEHDQRQAVGYATAIDEQPDGLYATFHVPPSALGDQVLAEAASGVRDAFSVGVQLDDVAQTKLRRAQPGESVAGAGALRETSVVSVPAFDDARMAASSGALVVSAWSSDLAVASTSTTSSTSTSPEHSPEPTAPAPAQPSREDSPMPDTVEPDAPTAPVIPQQEAPAAAAPAPLAVAGAALVTAEAATYTFSGDGPSLVADVKRAVHGDSDAAQRLARFNTELATGNPATYMALAAVATRSDLSELVNPSVRRPDLLLRSIDLGRPVWNQLQPTRIANAQPFLLPVEGEFTGVGPHTEGTAHVAEGTMTFGEVTVTPRAVSGAYRMSRELVDSSTPAADQLVVNAMLRNYAQVSEALAVAGLVAGAGAAVTGINTVNELSAQLLDFEVDNGYPPSIVVAGSTFYTALASEVDGDGRRMLPAVAPSNTAGTRTGARAIVDGVPVLLSRSVAAGDAFILAGDGVLVGESAPQVFRFDQPEGPGIIKVALFAYQVAAVTRTGAVRRLTSA